MKLNRVDAQGNIYEVTPKQTRVCAYVTCSEYISHQTKTGFCAIHRPSHKSSTGLRKVYSAGIVDLKIGDTCKIPSCSNYTSNVAGKCGYCSLRHDFRLSRTKPKAPYTPGGLKELEAIVAKEKLLAPKTMLRLKSEETQKETPQD